MKGEVRQRGRVKGGIDKRRDEKMKCEGIEMGGRECVRERRKESVI